MMEPVVPDLESFFALLAHLLTSPGNSCTPLALVYSFPYLPRRQSVISFVTEHLEKVTKSSLLHIVPHLHIAAPFLTAQSTH